MSSKNVNTKVQSYALKDTNLNTMTDPKSSWMIDSSKASSIGATDVPVNPIIVQPEVVVLNYFNYPPFSAEQRARVNDTYNSIAENMSDTKMAKTIQVQFLEDIKIKSESYAERVSAGEDIEDIRVEQAEFLNNLIEQTIASIEIINDSKTNADNEMKDIVSKIIVDMIKEEKLTINLEKIESVENDKIAARLVIGYKKDENDDEEVIYEGEEVVLWEFTDTQTSTPTP